MLCESCNKNQATIHYTKIINGKVSELHLCEECAKENNEFEFDATFSFHKLLTSLIDNIQSETMERDGEDIVCDFCGTSYSKFKQTGKFGCPKCYNSFKSKLPPLFKGIHGHNEHIGKVPKRGNQNIVKKREITRLREELEELVSVEAFEKAAVVRDKINELEKELEKKRGDN
jgi:protein arginine kinase activator